MALLLRGLQQKVQVFPVGRAAPQSPRDDCPTMIEVGLESISPVGIILTRNPGATDCANHTAAECNFAKRNGPDDQIQGLVRRIRKRKRSYSRRTPGTPGTRKGGRILAGDRSGCSV